MDFEDLPIGIDLGTTNSCIGVFRNGSVEIIPNQNQGKLVPSVVSFCGKKIAIGEQTLDQVYNDPEKVIYSIKRIIGRNSAEKEYEVLIENLAYKNKIKTDNKGRPFINVDFNGESRKYYPQEISAIILKKLKENAKIYLGKEIKKVVITIPAYFTDAQREATKEACILAGLEVIKIINEPTAAALAYGLKDKNDLLNSEEYNNFCLFSHKKDQNKKSNEKNEKTILVFDLGGGTFDVTCLKFINDDEAPIFEIKGHSGNTLLGGDDFDNILVDFCIKKFEKEYNKKKGKKKHIEINRESKEGLLAIKRLKIFCEKIKKRLSNNDKATILIHQLYEGKNFALEIDKDEFQNLCKKKFKELSQPIDDALKTAKIKKDDIDEILLAGGSTRIPKIKEILISYFRRKIIINDIINPDEVVAYGATLQAAMSMKKPAMEDILINEICPHSIGVGTIDIKSKEYICDILIEKGTNIPFENERNYSTYNDYQKYASINIYEGEELLCKDNRLLGNFELHNISIAKKGIPKIKGKIKIDEDSIIHVTAYEKLTGAKNSLDIKYDKKTLSKYEINNMKNRLQKNEEFEKININSKEKELSVEKNRLLNQYNENNSLNDLIELVDVQEKLVDIISLDNSNNNYERKFDTICELFRFYNFLFTSSFKEYKIKKDYYLEKIKRYMRIFKNGDPFYLKSLTLIFENDKYEERLVEIVYYCIILINSNIKKQNINKDFISYYYEEILELMDIFKKLIEHSKFKEKFKSLQNELILEREKLKFKFWPKDLTLDEAISALDQITYKLKNISFSKSKKSLLYEKSFRAYFITKLICLELTYFKNNDLDYLKYLKKLAEEALKFIKDCKIEDAWKENLWDAHKSISQKIEEKEKEESISRRNSVTSMSTKKIKEIYGNNDKQNIEFFEFLFNEVFKNSNENIKNLYNNDKKDLKKKTMRCINKLPNSNDEEKEFKSMVHTNFNKIEKYWKDNKLI